MTVHVLSTGCEFTSTLMLVKNCTWWLLLGDFNIVVETCFQNMIYIGMVCNDTDMFR